jgi:hypothetical protein
MNEICDKCGVSFCDCASDLPAPPTHPSKIRIKEIETLQNGLKSGTISHREVKRLYDEIRELHVIETKMMRVLQSQIFLGGFENLAPTFNDFPLPE